MHAPPVMRRPTVDPRTVAAVDNIRRLVQQDPGLLDQVMRTVPSYDSAPVQTEEAFRAYRAANGRYSQAGAQTGRFGDCDDGRYSMTRKQPRGFNTIQASDQRDRDHRIARDKSRTSR